MQVFPATHRCAENAHERARSVDRALEMLPAMLPPGGIAARAPQRPCAAPAPPRARQCAARVAQEDKSQLSASSAAPQRGHGHAAGHDAAPAGAGPNTHRQPELHAAPTSAVFAPTGSLSTSDASDDEAFTESSSSSSVDPASMFDTSHLPAGVTPQLALYFPAGVALAALRMALWIAGIAIDHPSFTNPAVVAAYLSLLGFSTRVRNAHLLPQGTHVLVSNHVSVGDLMLLFRLPQRYAHLVTSALPEATTRTRNLPARLLPASTQVIERLASWPQGSLPVHIFPEGGMTNGSAMLQFSRGFTKLLAPGVPVVPMAIKVRRCAGPPALPPAARDAGLAQLGACPGEPSPACMRAGGPAS